MLLFFSETNQGTLLHSSRFVLQKDHHLSSGKVLLFLFYQSKTSWIFDMSPWEIVTQDNKLFRAASIHANSPAMGEGGGRLSQLWFIFRINIRSHTTFMTSTKNNFLISTYVILKNQQNIYCLKETGSANLWRISRLPHRPTAWTL